MELPSLKGITPVWMLYLWFAALFPEEVQGHESLFTEDTMAGGKSCEKKQTLAAVPTVDAATLLRFN